MENYAQQTCFDPVRRCRALSVGRPPGCGVGHDNFDYGGDIIDHYIKLDFEHVEAVVFIDDDDDDDDEYRPVHDIIGRKYDVIIIDDPINDRPINHDLDADIFKFAADYYGRLKHDRPVDDGGGESDPAGQPDE